jgi:hypothetical protein
MTATTSQLGEGLFACLREVTALLGAARAAADDERDALVASDVKTLVRCCKAQDEALRRIAQADQRAAELAAMIADNTGLNPEDLGAFAIAEAVGAPYDSLIREEMGRISRLAEQLKAAHEVNKKLLTNGLEIVASCLRTLACETSPPSYSSDAAFQGPQPRIISLDSKA